MTSIKLIVNGATARAEVDGLLTSGMVGIPVTIEYDSDWDGLTKALVCKAAGSRPDGPGVVKAILNVENEATVAPEVMIAKKFLYLGVEGRNSDGTLVIPTIWALCGIIRSSADVDDDSSTDPTLPVWAQLQAQIDELKKIGVSDEQIAEAVEEYLEEHPIDIPDSSQNVDLSGYAKKSELPTKTSQLTNDSGFITKAPVDSVNGKTGAVNLTASDVGARPATWTPTAQEVGALPDTYTPPNQTAQQVGADPAGTAESKFAAHNVDTAAHSDIRERIAQLSNQIGGDVVPSYWQTALDTGVKAINTALCNAGRNKSAFLFYSDVHWNYGSQMSPRLLKYLYQHTGMNKTFFGGDIVNSEASDYDTMSYLWDWRRQLKDLPNHHSVPGNHDDGNATNNLFSEQYVYGYLLAAEETPDVVRGDSGLYYYIDSPAEKTRYLCLDTGYKDISALSAKQETFIKDSLKSTPDGWHIVVVAHIWYGLDYDQYDQRPVPIEGMSATATTVAAILDNYNSRSGEFAEGGGWVEFCIGGHIHYDYDAVTATGIPIILVETDSQHTRGNYTATDGTITESSVNGIIADYDAHEIHVVRIGRGESRTVEVTNYVVSYTNVLPTALAADGVSVYNADDTPGYKANTRWSTSSNSEIAAEGIHLTGWIPVSAGDVIRLKHITLPNESSNACMIHVFTDNFTTASGNINNADLNGHYSPVWDDSGNLTQFTVPSNASCTHLRIQCGGITDASIITINEPVE